MNFVAADTHRVPCAIRPKELCTLVILMKFLIKFSMALITYD